MTKVGHARPDEQRGGYADAMPGAIRIGRHRSAWSDRPVCGCRRPVHGAEPARGIIVTAERVETSLQSTPISVTAFGAEDLRQRGVTNLLEMSAFTPNLVVNTTPGNAITGGGFAIRGIGVDAGLPSVGVYVDEVYFPSGSGNILGVFDLERIEVLRGPQGTLFGRNTIAGPCNM